MLERQHPTGRILQRQSTLKTINRHNCAQREKNRRILTKQRSSFCLNVTNVDPNNNTDNKLSDKVRLLLLKHTKLGFIESFQNLSLEPERQTPTKTRIVSESDELVGQMPDNIYYEQYVLDNVINKEEFELGRVLGAGGFGSVYLGTFKRQAVAIKIMHKYTKNPAAQRESFKAELHVMRFNHPNIIKTLAATHVDKFDEGAWVVMEYAGSTTLQGIINDPDECIEADRRLKYSIQIASALSYAHKNKVAHLDLKPANVLITADDNCKVGDFGCSQKVEFDTGIISPTNRSILTGTFAYRAPELLKGQAPTFKADVYSYGVVMWQLRSREMPFTNQNQHVVIFGVVANGLRPLDPNPDEDDPFELSYIDLYRQCWQPCPLDRPSTHDLVEVLTIWKNNIGN